MLQETQRKTNIIKYILGGLLLIFFLAINGAGLYVGNLIYQEVSVQNLHLHDKNQPLLEKIRQENNGEDIILQSNFGYPLHGTYLPSPQATDQTVIFLHGFTENRAAGLSFAELYLKNGFNILLIDSRAHGDSGGANVTWGAYEKYDLNQWIDWLSLRFPTGLIGIHGKSMGAATALLHAELNESNKRVAFYIADSSYSDLETLLALKASQQLSLPNDLLPKILVQYANIIAYFKAGFTFHQSSPIQAIHNVTTPILYIHSAKDGLIPVQMSQELAQQTTGPHQLSIFPNAEHATAIFNNPNDYTRLVQDFINSSKRSN